MSFHFTDQLKRSIVLDKTPERIISVVPSQTELLFDLGLDAAVVGITKFCVHPNQWYRNKTRVGGTKNLNISLIKFLNPDLIIANKEENDYHQIKELSKQFPVWISDVNCLSDALDMITELGVLTGKPKEAKSIGETIKDEFDGIKTLVNPIKVAYLIWNNPIMLAGSSTFIHDMLKKCNFTNCFESHERYPEIDLDELKDKQPQLIMLSSEPFPFKNKHLNTFRKSFPNSFVILVDGEMFSWYGSRMKKSPAYFNQLIKQISDVPTAIS